MDRLLVTPCKAYNRVILLVKGLEVLRPHRLVKHQIQHKQSKVCFNSDLLNCFSMFDFEIETELFQSSFHIHV